MTTNHVFVYGSLRMHEHNHHILAGSERVVAQCAMKGKLYDTGNGYPSMVFGSEGNVYGELYRVSDEVLARLDILEGYNGEGEANHYERSIGTVSTDQGELEAYVYTYSEEKAHGLTLIEYGDWKYHKLVQAERSIVYFAFGSCMDDERFKIQQKDHLFQDVLGQGILEGYSLKFTHGAHDGGRADMMEIGGHVEGKVYRINDEALDYLLIREGVEQHIYRPGFVDIQVGDAMIHDALTFFVIDKAEQDILPPDHYSTEIRRGGQSVWTAEYEAKFEELLRGLEGKD